MQSKYVIVGAGDVARHLLGTSLRSEILAVADNKTAKYGTDFHGFEVSSVNDAVAKYGLDANYLVCVYNGSQVREQLKDLGCINIKPFVTYWREHRGELPKLACLMDDKEILSDEAFEIGLAACLWSDKESFCSFGSLIDFHQSEEYDPVLNPRPMSEMYFDEGLFELRNDDAFFDCGAYDGDTIREIFKRKPGFNGKVLAVEPDPVNFERLCDYVMSMDDPQRDIVEPFNQCLGSSHVRANFRATGGMGSALAEDGTSCVQITTLDYICNPSDKYWLPTIIKMDIEGAEIDALNGAAETIKKHVPILAICVYHKLSDLWRIPLLIRKLNPDYKLYLRRYAEDCWETVCYAVPPHRCLSKGFTKVC